MIKTVAGIWILLLISPMLIFLALVSAFVELYEDDPDWNEWRETHLMPVNYLVPWLMKWL